MFDVNQLIIFQHVYIAGFINTKPAGTSGDLPHFCHVEHARGHAVEFMDMRKNHAPYGQVQAHTYRIGRHQNVGLA